MTYRIEKTLAPMLGHLQAKSFGSASRFASWVGICPGREESAEHFRLESALQTTLSQMASHIPLVSRVQFPAFPIPNETALELLRIAQEALINAAKHSGASKILFNLSPAEGNGIRIAIADNGKGFNSEKPGHGFGLIGMQERAARIQAQFPRADVRAFALIRTGTIGP